MGKEYLRSLVESTDTRNGKVFTYSIQCLIILSLITFSIDTLPDLSVETKSLLFKIEAITVFIFTAEYLIRFYVAEKHIKLLQTTTLNLEMELKLRINLLTIYFDTVSL